MIARDAVHQSGALNTLHEFAKAENAEDRIRVRNDWEQKMAARNKPSTYPFKS